MPYYIPTPTGPQYGGPANMYLPPKPKKPAPKKPPAGTPKGADAAERYLSPPTAKAPDFSRPKVEIKTIKTTSTVSTKKKKKKKKKKKSSAGESGNSVDATPGNTGGGSRTQERSDRAVKSAPIDTVTFVDEAFSEEAIIDLLFEIIGGQEILSIARADTVNGQNVVYQPIRNLNILEQTYNSGNLLRLLDTSTSFFNNFSINLREKIPFVGNATEETGGTDGGNYYVESTNGDIIIELINMLPDEQVEIQITSAAIIDNVGI
jgi:hypothetical protein